MSLAVLCRWLDSISVSNNLNFFASMSPSGAVTIRTNRFKVIRFVIDEDDFFKYRVEVQGIYFVFDDVTLSYDKSELWFYVGGNFAGCIPLN